jgi:hypothetical protein
MADKEVKTFIQAAEKLYKEGFTQLIMVAGSDRIKEFQTLLDRYNGKPDKKGKVVFDFPEGVRVVSSGERDPDSADPTEAISASVMRAAAQSGDFDTFKKGSPLKETDAKKLYLEVRKAMGVREVKEDLTIDSDYDALRDAYLRGEWGNIGDIVEASGFSGEVVRRGTNYLSFVDEDGKFHKAFLHQIDERAWYSALGGKIQKKTSPRTFEKMAKQYADLAKKPEYKGKPNLAAAQIALQYKDVNPRTLISYINDLVMQGKLPKELRASYMPTFKESTSVKQDKHLDRPGTQPKKYYAKDAEGDEMSKSTKQARARHFEKGADKDDDDPNAYKPAPGDKSAKTKLSKHTKKVRQMYPDLYDEEAVKGKDVGYPDESVKIGKKHYIIYKGGREWYGYEVDKEGNQLGDSVFDPKKSELIKILAQEGLDERNYAKEYANYQGTPEQIARRSSRNKARRIMGDKAIKGKDIGHKDNNPLNNDPKNLRNEDPSTNRREPRLREGAADSSLAKKADKSGISVSILKQVYNRGVAAWRTGHRPGTTPEQWGHARVNSFISKSSGTWGGADKDLAAKAKGKSESVDLGESWKPSTVSGYSALMFAKEFPEHEVKGAFQYHPDVVAKMEEACCEDCETESVLIENNQYRVGSETYFEYFNDMRKMYNEGRLEVTGFDKELMEGDLGNFATYEEQVVPLDCPMMEEEEKNPPLNKPKAGGPKKYYVYVRDPSTGNIKKVTWGDTTGLKVKLNDPAARKSFAARHKCDQQKDKTKASYWACNLPRYASQLGLSGGGNFYW